MTETAKWYEKAGSCGDVVVSTRVRLARNLKQYPFPARALASQREAVERQVKDALLSGNSILSKEFRFIPLENTTQEEAVSLVERHIVSPEFIADRRGKAVLISADESISIMVNEEDHLRIQVLREGFSLKEAAETADRIDTLLSENLDFAFDPELGYLTQCPTNLGTGLRASVMLHLPGLTESGAMPRIASNLSKLGLTIRGTYGEGSKSIGALYQLSNQITLGLSENEAIENLRSITVQLMEEERKARAQMSEEIAWQDKIDRAAGVLKSARVLSSSEFMELLSYIRLGLSTGVLQGVTTQELNALMVNAQPATLMARAGKQLDETQRDVLRADIAREVCAKIKE
ncbi:MAG: protein arginine kinase [Acutalibacter sp.]